MKNFRFLFIALISVVCLLCFNSCEEKDDNAGILEQTDSDDSEKIVAEKPIIEAKTAVSDYTTVSVIFKVTSNVDITKSGVYFGYSANSLTVHHEGSITGTSGYLREGYACGTNKTVYFYAYAENSAGRTVSSVYSKKTLSW